MSKNNFILGHNQLQPELMPGRGPCFGNWQQEIGAQNATKSCTRSYWVLLFSFFPFIFWLGLRPTVGNGWITGELAWIMCLHQHHPPAPSSFPAQQHPPGEAFLSHTGIISKCKAARLINLAG